MSPMVRIVVSPEALKVYIPGSEFPSVSLTGTSCSLNCAHCGRHYLRGMLDGRVSLLKACSRPGVTGCLISGGFDERLKVPIDEHVDELKELKRRGLRINAHVGFIDEDDLDWVKYVDVVSFDFVGDRSVVKRVYGIDKGIEDYLKVMDMLSSEGVKVAPHVTLGLDFGRVWWETNTIDRLKDYDPEVIVLDVLIPTRGTTMGRVGVKAPSVEESLAVVEHARDVFDGELSVGCMRPGGTWRREFDMGAVRLGVNRLVNPPRSILKWARHELGMDVEVRKECCVI